MDAPSPMWSSGRAGDWEFIPWCRNASPCSPIYVATPFIGLRLIGPFRFGRGAAITEIATVLPT